MKAKFLSKKAQKVEALRAYTALRYAYNHLSWYNTPTHRSTLRRLLALSAAAAGKHLEDEYEDD